MNTKIRIAVDQDCPSCGFPELSGALEEIDRPRLLCRSCGWNTDIVDDSPVYDDDDPINDQALPGYDETDFREDK